MKLEEKDLLLKDVCARLPYKPIVHAQWIYHETDGSRKHKEADRPLEINDFYAIWNVKPYLRPLSSMTGEEKEEYNTFFTYDGIDETCFLDYLDWLNSHRFDYRGLIEKGLALEAPEGMYNTE